MRLGQTTVEDFVRLDDGETGQSWVGGEFSPGAQGYAVTTEIDRVYQAKRLVNFDDKNPLFIDVTATNRGLIPRFGPWLDDHQIVLYETDTGGYRAENCRIIDLDSPEFWWDFPELDPPGTRYQSFIEVSPRHQWLVQLTTNDTHESSLVVAPILSSGLGAFTRVVELGANEGPARVSFSADESYLVVESYDKDLGLLHNRVYPVRLGEPPVALSPYDLPTNDRLNYVKLAPTGSRFFVHSRRTLANGNGSTPITVIDAETGSSVQVTPEQYSSSSPGFTQGGFGVLSDGYFYGTTTYGMEWFGVPADFSPSASIPLVSSKGFRTCSGGWSSADAWYGLCTSNASNSPDAGPVDLERFDFGPGYLGPTYLTRLSEYTNVDNWRFASDTKALVYRVAVTSDVYDSSDPLTRGHYTHELGAYWVPVEAGAKPVRLNLVWTAYDSINWLPDNRGLLRRGPEAKTNVVTDAQYGDGTGVQYVSEGAAQELDWLRFDGGAGVVTKLAPYLGNAHVLSDLDEPEVPDRWSVDE
jgi:hypothetical protein